MASIIQTANPAGVTATSNVATYSTQSIGVAAPNRIIVVAVAVELSSATPSGCTIDYGSGDTAMTAAPSGAGNFGAVYTQLYYLKVPTGTTATIKVTYSATNPTNLQNHIAVYRTLGVKYSSSGNDGSTDMDATDPLTTGSITIPSGGVFIAVAGGATDGTGKTWANATEDIDADAGSLRFTTAIRDTALTTTAVTCTGGTNGEDGALSYIIFAADVSPTVALNSPADASSGSDTTPTLDFTGTDTESNDVTYQLQIDTVNTFDSQSPSVEVGNVTTGSASTGAGPFTVSHNNNKEDVYVFVAVRDDANNTLSVKYGGVDMTSIGNHTVTAGSVLEAQIFYLANAPIGANEVLVSTSGSIGDVLGFGAISTKNAAQTSPVEATTTGGETPGVEDPRSTSVTTLTTNGLVIDAISDRSAGLTVGGSSTQIFKLGSGDNMAASYRLPTSTGAYAMEWDPTENTEDWAQVVLAIKKAGRPLLSKFSHLDLGFTGTLTGNHILPRNVTSGNDVDGGSTATTTSVTPQTNNLYLLTVASRTGITADPNEPTATGNGLTWEVVDTIVYDSTSSSRRRLTVFRALGASPTAGTIAIDFGGQAQTDIGWSLDEYSNVDISGTNGSGAIVQSVSNKDETGTATSLTATLAAFASSQNATFGAFGISDSGVTKTAGTGFTKYGDGDAGGANGLAAITEFKTTNDTGVDMSFSSGTICGAIAIEIKAGQPYQSGQAATYTVQAGDALAADTYYWRVRAVDPSGSGVYGAWSSTRSFTVTSGGAAYEQDCNEIFTLVDVVRKKPTRVLGEITTLVDTTRKSESRIIVEAITLVDTVKRTTSRALSEIVSLVDTIRKLPTKVQAEVVTLVDTFSRIWTAHKSLSEILTLVDVVLKKPIKVLIESFSLVDTIRKAQSTVKAEVITLVDTFSRVLTAVRSLAEAFVLVDTVSKIKGGVATLAESFTLVDTSRKVTSRVLSEVVSLVDSVIKQIIFIRNLTEAFTLVDTISQVKTYIRNLTENFTLADSFSSIFDSVVSGLGRISRGFIRQVRDNLPPFIRSLGDSSGEVREARDSSGVIEQIKDNSSPKGVIIKDKDKPEIR